MFLIISNLSSAQTLIIKSINFEGNKVTKEKILKAELKIQIGDTINLLELENILTENSNRLYNLQLFHWVKNKFEIIDNRINVIFMIQERWYIWPTPILSFADRNVNAWINKMDFNRLDYGLHTAWYNFRGKNEQLISNIQHGFNRKYELFYKIPQINKKQTIGLDLGVSYYQSHYLDYINIESRPKTLRLENQFPINRKYARVGIINRNTAENIHNFRFEINQQTINDSILILNPDFHKNGIEKTFFQFEFSKVLNHRRNFSYPTSGSFLEIAFRQRFFFEKEENPSSRFQLNYSKYIPLSKKIFYSFGINGQYSINKNVSTSENIALGYNHNIRGFDYYVIDGQHFGTLKQNISLLTLNDKKVKLNFIPSEKFNEIPLSIYYTLFTDGGYVYDNIYNVQNIESNKYIYSVGTGIHFVSYYDQVFVLEYTLNSLKEQGIFVSTKFSF